MTRKLLVILFSLLFLTFVPQVNAQAVTTGSAKTTTTANTQTATDSASKLKQQMLLLQEQKKTAVTQIKDDAKTSIQATRDEFVAKLQTIKDQKKKTLVQLIDTKMAEINKNQTTKFSKTLIMIQAFLDRIKLTTTDPAGLAGVSTAQSVIDTAKAAVAAQVAKVYTIQITDDAALRLNAGTTVNQLRQELMGVYAQVVNSKLAVQKLNIEKAVIKKEATSSANL